MASTYSDTLAPGSYVPKPDLGVGEAIVPGFAAGFHGSITGTLVESTAYLAARHNGTPMTKEFYDKNYAGMFEYDKDITEEEGQVRASYARDKMLRADTIGKHSTTALVAGLAGGIVNPDLALFSFVKPFTAASWYTNALAKMPAADVALHASKSMSFSQATEVLANNVYNGFMGNAVMEPVMLVADNFNQVEHNAVTAGINLLTGAGMGLTIGGAQIMYRSIRPDIRQQLGAAILKGRATGEPVNLATLSPEVAAELKRVNTETKNPAADLLDDLVPMEGPNDLNTTGIFRRLASITKRGIKGDTPASVRARDMFLSIIRRNAISRDDIDVLLRAGLLDPAEAKRAQRTGLTDTVLDPSQKAAILEEQKRVLIEKKKQFINSSRAAKSFDENLLSQAMDTVFGTKVRFVDDLPALETGFLGMFSKNTPDHIYIRTGDLSGGNFSMLKIAGHEMFHGITLRDPEMAAALTNTMLDPAISRHFGQAWRDTVQQKRKNGSWKMHSPMQRMDETVATIFGHAMQTRDFWHAINQTEPVQGQKLAGLVMDAYNKVSALVARTGVIPKGFKAAEMESQLAKIVMAMNEAGTNTAFKGKVPLPENWKTSRATLYANYREQIGNFRNLHRETVLVAERSLREAADQNLVTVRQIEETLFKEHGTLTDTSLIPSSPQAKKRVFRGVGNIQSFLLNSFIRGNSGRAQKIKDMMKRGASKQGSLDQMPLATYKEVSKPVWNVKKQRFESDYEVTIYNDSKHLTWTEDRGTLDWDGFTETQLLYQEHYQSLVDALTVEVNASLKKKVADDKAVADKKAAGNKKAAVELEPGKPSSLVELKDAELAKAGQAQEVLDFLSQYEISELTDPLNVNSAQWLIDEFTRYLSTKMSQALADNDPLRFGVLRDLHIEEIGGRLVPGEASSNAVVRQSHEGRINDLNEVLSLARKEWEVQNGRSLDDPSLSSSDIPSGDVAELGVARALQNKQESMLKAEMDWLFNNTDEGPLIKATYEAASKELKAKFIADLQEKIDQIIYDNYPALRAGLKTEFLSKIEKGYRDPVSGKWKKHAADMPLKEEHLAVGQEHPIQLNDEWKQDLPSSEDLAMELPLEEQLRVAEGILQQRRSEGDTQFSRLTAQLDQEHKGTALYREDPVKAVLNDLTELLDKHGLVYGPDTAKPLVGESTAANKRMQTELARMYKKMVSVQEYVTKISDGTAPKAGSVDSSHAVDVYDHFFRLTNDRKQAAALAEADINHFYNSLAREYLMDQAGINRIDSFIQQSHKHLRSHIDGEGRVGVNNREQSVDALRQAQIYADTLLFHQALARAGLTEMWNSNALVPEVMRYLEPGGKSKNKYVQHIGDVLRKTTDMQAGRLISRGSSFRMLDGYAFSRQHNGAMISEHSGDWFSFMHDSIDWDHLNKKLGLANTAEARQQYLDAVHKNLTSPPVLTPEGIQNGVFNQSQQHRDIQFRSGIDADFKYDMKFGSGNTAAEIYSQIMRRAEKSVFMQEFGPRYKQNWDLVMANEGLGGKSTFSDLRQSDLAFKTLTGETDNPVDVTMDRRAKSAQYAANMSMLTLSAVSAITDYAFIMSNLRYSGMSVGTSHGELLSALKRAALDPQGRVMLEGMGSALDAALAAASRDPLTGFHGMMRKGNELAMKYTLMQAEVRVAQDASYDLFSQQLGEAAGMVGALPEQFKNMLSFYGVSEAEFGLMAKGAKEIQELGGGARLSPDLVSDPKLALKLRAMMWDHVSYGQLRPSLGNRAMVRNGSQAGTAKGTAYRFFAQYKEYPMAVLTKVQGRINFGHGSVEAPTLGFIPQGAGRTEKIALAAGLLTTAFLAVAIKDILNGREPLNPFEASHWNMNNLGRIVMQAGFGPVSIATTLLEPKNILGPVPNMAIGMGSAALHSLDSGSLYRNTEAVTRYAPWALLGPLAPVAKNAERSMLGMALGEAYVAQREALQRFIEHKTGQEGLLDFK